jgi:hypothetical protein
MQGSFPSSESARSDSTCGANTIEGKPAISEEDAPYIAMSAIPGTGSVGKLGKLGKAGGEVLRPLSKVDASTLRDGLRSEKLDHVFVPKHNVDPLVGKYGTREAAMEQIVRALGCPDLPSSGRVEVTQLIGGQDVVIRGAVVDDIPRIGTAFTR